MLIARTDVNLIWQKGNCGKVVSVVGVRPNFVTCAVITDKISDFLFAPTKTAVKNLKKMFKGEMRSTSDVIMGVLLKYKEITEEKSKILEKLELTPREYLLVTIQARLVLDLWLVLNDFLGTLREGYWTVPKYKKKKDGHVRTDLGRGCKNGATYK